MSSWLPGRQSTLGLAILGVGTSFAFLFFYSPRSKQGAGFDARSLDVHPGLGFPTGNANETSITTLPRDHSMRPTRWLVTNESGRTSSRPLASERTHDNGNHEQLGSPVIQSLDQLLSQPPQVDSLPKAYPTPTKQMSVPSPKQVSIANQSPDMSDLVPLPAPTPIAENAGSRFGAGRYRPNLPPATVPMEKLPSHPVPAPQWAQQPPMAAPAEQASSPASGPGQLVGQTSLVSPAPLAPSLSAPPVTSPPLNLGEPQKPADVFSRYDEKRTPQFVRQPRSFR